MTWESTVSPPRHSSAPHFAHFDLQTQKEARKSPVNLMNDWREPDFPPPDCSVMPIYLHSSSILPSLYTCAALRIVCRIAFAFTTSMP